MNICTLLFASVMTISSAYVLYLAFCDVYALITNTIEDFASKSLFEKLDLKF